MEVPCFYTEVFFTIHMCVGGTICNSGSGKKANSHFYEADPLLLPVGTKNEPINVLFFHFITQHLLNAYGLLGLSYPTEI